MPARSQRSRSRAAPRTPARVRARNRASPLPAARISADALWPSGAPQLTVQGPELAAVVANFASLHLPRARARARRAGAVERPRPTRRRPASHHCTGRLRSGRARRVPSSGRRRQRGPLSKLGLLRGPQSRAIGRVLRHCECCQRRLAAFACVRRLWCSLTPDPCSHVRLLRHAAD